MSIIQEFLNRSQKTLIKEKVLYINVKVIPKAAKTELVEIMEDGEGNEILKVKLAAVPEKGKANQGLCRFFAQLFSVPKSSVNVSQGQTSQRKVLKIVL